MTTPHKKLLHATSGWLFLQLSLLPPALVAGECSATSGAETVSLLELYTSEGCSSCPPADKWLSTLKPDNRKLIPLAFHVDYWDYIGWKDKFGKAEYSERQRNISARGGARFVYTPQFVLNGRDFRGLNASRLNDMLTDYQKTPPRANLHLHLSNQVNGKMSLHSMGEVSNKSDIKNAEVFVAIYENGLVSQVKAGENDGRELHHDAVVRYFFGGFRFNDKGTFSKEISLDAQWNSKVAGAVMFVQDTQNGEILQALQLPFCKS